jgi:hypothetical protein
MTTTDTAEPMAYIARAACSCIKLATVDTPARAKTNAKEIAACVKLGYTIERVTCSWVRENFVSSCEVCRPKKKVKRQEQQESFLC